MTTQSPSRTTDVLIIGGGPAGSLLATLLARRGIEVTLVERQAHLERDFRGETVAAPSVLSLRKLGFGPALEARGYLRTAGVRMIMEGRSVFHVDYGRFGLGELPIDIPQPSLIGAFNEAAAGLPTYTYLNGMAFSELIEQDGAVVGATLNGRDQEPVSIRARLVVGSDGRFSAVRKASGLTANVQPMGRDFQWFKLPRPADWGSDATLVVDHDRHLVVLPTFPEWLRIGHNLPKGRLKEQRRLGFDAFKQGIVGLDPRLESLVAEHLTSWSDTAFLDVFTAELPQWTRDGLLLVGDASHTCTPILGQGVNLAIQDAIVFAPVIAAALAEGTATVRREQLAPSVAARQGHKRTVTSFQRMQEEALTRSRPLEVALRRTRFRVLDHLPLKYRLFAGMLGTPHVIDPVDLELAAVVPLTTTTTTRPTPARPPQRPADAA